RLVALVLEDKDFTVSLAADSRTALISARAERPQLVLLDYMLPGEDGEAVARQLRDVIGNVPILLMSAVDDPGQKARQVGAVGRIDKPFDLDDLEASVSRTLRVAGMEAGLPLVREDVRPAGVRLPASHRSRPR
ncbi:MAG: response regulator transcription factor, partial [Candidatus Saccharimonadales bacterium]